MISRFYTTTFAVSRLVYTDGIGNYGGAGTFVGHLQQASQLASVNGINMESISHTVWCAPGTNVRIGDTISAHGRSYSVRGIQQNDHAGANTHLELLVERDDIVSA